MRVLGRSYSRPGTPGSARAHDPFGPHVRSLSLSGCGNRFRADDAKREEPREDMAEPVPGVQTNHLRRMVPTPRRRLMLAAALGAAGVLAWLAFGVFGVQGLFIDDRVDEADPSRRRRQRLLAPSAPATTAPSTTPATAPSRRPPPRRARVPHVRPMRARSARARTPPPARPSSSPTAPRRFSAWSTSPPTTDQMSTCTSAPASTTDKASTTTS